VPLQCLVLTRWEQARYRTGRCRWIHYTGGTPCTGWWRVRHYRWNTYRAQVGGQLGTMQVKHHAQVGAGEGITGGTLCTCKWAVRYYRWNLCTGRCRWRHYTGETLHR